MQGSVWRGAGGADVCAAAWRGPAAAFHLAGRPSGEARVGGCVDGDIGGFRNRHCLRGDLGAGGQRDFRFAVICRAVLPTVIEASSYFVVAGGLRFVMARRLVRANCYGKILDRMHRTSPVHDEADVSTSTAVGVTQAIASARALRRITCGGCPKARRKARRMRSRSAKPVSCATT